MSIEVKRYKIKEGDTLSSIAERFNMTVKELIEFNGVRDLELVPGNHILVPS